MASFDSILEYFNCCYAYFSTANQAKKACELLENFKTHGCILKCKYYKSDKKNDKIAPLMSLALAKNTVAVIICFSIFMSMFQIVI